MKLITDLNHFNGVGKRFNSFGGDDRKSAI